jgi:hypothetical protein
MIGKGHARFALLSSAENRGLPRTPGGTKLPPARPTRAASRGCESVSVPVSVAHHRNTADLQAYGSYRGAPDGRGPRAHAGSPATEESQFCFTRQVVLNCPVLLFYCFYGRGSQSGGVHDSRGTCMHDFRLRAEAMSGGCTAVRGICCDEALLSPNGAGKTH